MKAAKRFECLAKVVILGLLVATFIFAPLCVVTVNADGGSNGYPGEDTTKPALSVGDIPEADDPLLVESVTLTLLRLIDL